MIDFFLLNVELSDVILEQVTPEEYTELTKSWYQKLREPRTDCIFARIISPFFYSTYQELIEDFSQSESALLLVFKGWDGRDKHFIYQLEPELMRKIAEESEDDESYLGPLDLQFRTQKDLRIKTGISFIRKRHQIVGYKTDGPIADYDAFTWKEQPVFGADKRFIHGLWVPE